MFERRPAIHRFPRATAYWGLSAWLAVAAVNADPAPPESEADYLAQVPVVVSATRLAQRVQDAPVAVTVINRDEIEAAGILHIADILRLVPGFQVGHTSANLFTVSSHGTATPWFSRVQVLIDGRSRYHTTFSGLEWASLGISLADIERVEVVRGANIPAYGSNAIMGTVNIITRQPFRDRGLFVQGAVGSQDWTQGVLRYAGRLGPMDFRVTLEHREDHGFPGVEDDTRITNPSFRGIIDLTPTDELDIHLGFTDGDMGTQLHLDFDLDERDITTDYQFVRWTHAADSDQSFYVQFTRDHYDTREDSRVDLAQLGVWAGIPPGLAEPLLGPLEQQVSFNNFNGVSDRYELEFQHFSSPLEGLRLTWGAGYRWEHMEDDKLGRDADLSANSARLSANLEWRPDDRLVANLGALLETTTVTDDTALSPRLGINYELAPGQTLRASLTRAHKFPSLLEEHWQHVIARDDGTPLAVNIATAGDLDPETRDQIEIGYLGRALGGALTFDTRLYHEDVRNAVIYAYDFACPEQRVLLPLLPAGCYRVGNHMDYRVNGFEAALDFRAGTATRARLTYAYAQAEGTVPETLNPTLHQDLSATVPRHSGSLLLSQRLPRDFQASATFYFMDDLFWWVDGNAPLEDYLRVDLRLSKAFRRERGDGLIELIVQGLGDRYNEFTPRNTFEPRVYLRAGLQLR